MDSGQTLYRITVPGQLVGQTRYLAIRATQAGINLSLPIFLQNLLSIHILDSLMKKNWVISTSLPLKTTKVTWFYSETISAISSNMA